MGFLQKLADLLGGSSSSDVYWIQARCNRCGEVIKSRVNLRNDLSVEYSQKEGNNQYICRKVLSGDGSNLCFQKIEVYLKFDANRNLIAKEIVGGEFLEADMRDKNPQ